MVVLVVIVVVVVMMMVGARDLYYNKSVEGLGDCSGRSNMQIEEDFIYSGVLLSLKEREVQGERGTTSTPPMEQHSYPHPS